MPLIEGALYGHLKGGTSFLDAYNFAIVMMKSNMDSLVTISIPIYNAERFLRDAILSVINQTYKDWTLLLINDGSTDNSLSIMQEFEGQDSRIVIINDGLNKGLITRLNESIAMCNTKYYARMDADDIMCVSRIKEQVNFLEEHPDVDVCGTSIMTIDGKNNIIGSGFYNGKAKGFVHPTVMGKSVWFKSNPYVDWALRAEDFELWTRTSINSNFYAIGKPLLFYREFGVPTFKKYFLSQKTLIKVASNYKQYEKSFSWFLKLSASACAKIVLASLFSVMGKIDLIVSMRRRTTVPEALVLKKTDLNAAISNP